MNRATSNYKNLLPAFALGTLILVLIISACDRVGRAPEDLDLTPSATPTDLPTPTPIPDAEASLAEGVLQAQLDAIIEVIPSQYAAGGVDWQRQGTEFDEPNTQQTGEGIKFTIKDQIGSEAEITYLVFASPEEAQAHYDRWTGVREQILGNNPEPNDLFSTPNIFSRGSLYGAVSLMIIDEVYFVETFIKSFSSTQGNPLISLSRQAVNVLEEGIANYGAEEG